LLHQGDALSIPYELLVADDCSTDEEISTSLAKLNDRPHCKCIRFDSNKGRSATRNWLGEHAVYEYLLFLDSDGEITNKDFLNSYVDCMGKYDVVCGSIKCPDNCPSADVSLRYKYEKEAEKRYIAAMRMKKPFASFRSFNFLIRKEVFLKCEFDERFIHYGYEDLLFGKSLKSKDITILHIDNPLINKDFEPNGIYLKKVEISNATLCEFYDDIGDDSRLIKCYRKLSNLRLNKLVAKIYRTFHKVLRSNLLGNTPSLFVFAIYKIGDFCSVMDKKRERAE